MPIVTLCKVSYELFLMASSDPCDSDYDPRKAENCCMVFGGALKICEMENIADRLYSRVLARYYDEKKYRRSELAADLENLTKQNGRFPCWAKIPYAMEGAMLTDTTGIIKCYIPGQPSRGWPKGTYWFHEIDATPYEDLVPFTTY